MFSVTAVDQNSEFNSLWLLKSGEVDSVKNYDDLLRCGDLIVLEHVITKKYLITNTDSPMLSKNYTAGCVERNRVKPENYTWKVECANQVNSSVVQGFVNQIYYLQSQK